MLISPMSALGQKQTCTVHAFMYAKAISGYRPGLFDHLVGAGEQFSVAALSLDSSQLNRASEMNPSGGIAPIALEFDVILPMYGLMSAFMPPARNWPDRLIKILMPL